MAVLNFKCGTCRKSGSIGAGTFFACGDADCKYEPREIGVITATASTSEVKLKINEEDEMVNNQKQIEELTNEYREKVKQLRAEYSQKKADIEQQIAEKAIKERLFMPKEGECYWFVYSDGSVGCCLWVETPEDVGKLSIGNVVKTKEEALFRANKCQVEQALKEYILKYDPRPITKEDWKDYDLRKYFMTCRTRDNAIEIDYTFVNKRANQVYASDANTLRGAIKSIGEDKVLKYHFEVD